MLQINLLQAKTMPFNINSDINDKNSDRQKIILLSILQFIEEGKYLPWVEGLSRPSMQFIAILFTLFN